MLEGTADFVVESLVERVITEDLTEEWADLATDLALEELLDYYFHREVRAGVWARVWIRVRGLAIAMIGTLTAKRKKNMAFVNPRACALMLHRLPLRLFEFIFPFLLSVTMATPLAPFVAAAARRWGPRST